MGKVKRSKPGLFNKLGNDRPSVARANRFENELLVFWEDNKLPKDAIKFEYEGSNIKILLGVESIPPAILDEIVDLVKGFKDGDFLPPNEEELEDMLKLKSELEG